tara:strand:+ start:742 stop:1092 length:351 start_codon:yes stop_codon:yes gene_type:complete
MSNLAFGGDKEDEWEEYKFTVDKVKPNGVIVLDDGLEVELHKTDMRIRLDDGKKARAIGVIDAEVLYERCPLCDEDIREGDIVILTDMNFSLYPCHSCRKMVEHTTPKSNFKENIQ